MIRIEFEPAKSPEQLAEDNGFEVPADAKRFFVTFGQQYRHEPHPSGLPCHPDGFWEILAKDETEARQYLNTVLQNRWSFLYAEEEWDGGKDESGRDWYPMGRIWSAVTTRAWWAR